MKFLDLNGLTYFFGKVKTWTGNNYLSLKGGNIDGTIKATIGFVAEDPDDEEVSVVKVQSGTGIDISVKESGNSVIKTQITKSGVYAPIFKKNNGTPTQVLIADGSVKEIGSANGVAGLDSNGYVPLSQLGNLDTTVAEVVTALPTTNIKKHIYLIRDTNGVTQNQYEEYIYTGDTSAAYDDSKWEKLGDFRATVDLADYAKKVDAVNLNGIALEKEAIASTPNGLIEKQSIKFSNINDSNSPKISFEDATTNMAGFMSVVDKNKLDGIAPNANNYSLPLAANGTRGGIQVGYAANGRNYPVQLSGEKAYVNVPWTDTNTTYDLSPYAKTADVNAALSKKVDVVSGKGLSTEDFTAALKTKLNGIATGATADSAITTAEIDALFA